VPGSARVLVCADAGHAGKFAALRDDRRQVSLVLADQRLLPGTTGTELLARVRQFYSVARRILLLTWGRSGEFGADPAGDRPG
jgi:hypothetical protein